MKVELLGALLSGVLAVAGWAGTMTGITDSITFGDQASATQHHLTNDHSQTLEGGLGEPARELVKVGPRSTVVLWFGGR